MRTPLLVVLGLVAVGVVVWLGLDQGWFDGRAGEDRSGTDAEAPDEATAAGLATRDPAASAVDPATFEGDPVGTLTLAGLGDAAVHGVVTGGGAPVRFARVALSLPPPHGIVAARTTKEGTFAIRGLASEAYALRVSAEGWRTRTVVTPPLAAGKDLDLGEIALNPRPPQNDGIEAKVLDAAGRPVPGAKVTVTTLGYSLYLAMPAEMHGVTEVIDAHATTDDTGVARIVPLQPEKYDVVVRATGFALQVVQNVVVAQGRVERVTFKLTPGLAISGTVVGPDDVGLSGGYVFGMHQPSFRMYETVRTGAGGAFTLGGLDPGSYWLMAGHDDFGMGNDRKVKAGDTNVKVTLSGAGTLAGRVVRADGKPATKFVLRPFPVGQPFGYVFSAQFRVEDAEGRFEVKLPPDNYQVDAKEDAGSYVPGPTAAVKVGERTEVEVRLPPWGTVRGFVVDPAGDHVAGAEVYVSKGGFPPTPVRELYVRSDADGAFRLDGLPLERVGLHVRHPSYALRVEDVVPAPPESAPETTIRLAAGGRVEGRVLRGDDAPGAGEQVNLFKGFDFFNAKTTFTDAEGRFAFAAVAPDTYQVSLGKFENMGGGQQKSVTVPADGTATLDFRTEARTAGTVTVSGVVTAGGKPVAGATVFLVDRRGNDSTVTTTTDDRGRYEATGLEPGNVRVSVLTAEGMSTAKTLRGALPDKPATLDVTFGNQRVTGRVLEEDGRLPLSGAEVYVELTEAPSDADSAWDSVRGWATADKTGAFAVGGLDPGTYRIRAQHFGRATRVLDPFRLGEGETKEVGDIRLPLGAALRGRVTDGDGRPVEHAGVSLKDSGGKDVFLFSLSSSGSDGRYEVPGLQLGTYTVRIEAKGYAPFEARVNVDGDGEVVDAVVEKGGAVAVVVEDPAGNPVAGARVEIVDSQGRTVTRTFSIVNLFDADVTRTNAEGKTTIPDLAPGSYEFGAKKDGMVLAGERAPAGVSSGRTASVRVVLRPAP